MQHILSATYCWGGATVVEVESELVLDLIFLPCLCFTLVELLELSVLELPFESELVVELDESAFLTFPLSPTTVVLVDWDSVELLCCAIMAAVVRSVAKISFFMVFLLPSVPCNRVAEA
jgi:hypothetical protein